MCGLADYEALNTSILRMLGLAIAGLAGVAIHRAVRFLRDLKTRSRECSGASPAAERTGTLAGAGVGGHAAG